MKENAVKYQYVRDELRRAIQAGEFAGRKRLPPERELAERFGISRMTARRAIEDLAEADLIERRTGSGSYIRSGTPDRLAHLTVHQILMAYENAMVQDFLRVSGELIGRAGWNSHIIRVQTGYERTALKALRSGDPALIWANENELAGPLGTAVQAAANRAVLVGNEVDDPRVPCVLANDERVARTAVEHLRENGHERIAFLGAYPESHNESVQIAAWREALRDVLADKDMEQRLISVRPPRMANGTEPAYHAVRQYLEREAAGGMAPSTAVISTADEMTVGLLAAYRDAGKAVPEGISVVNLQESAMMKFAYPAVTCIDVNFSQQIETAFDMISRLIAGTLPPEGRHVKLEPTLVIRDSVRRIS